jgi:hypothetical protein
MSAGAGEKGRRHNARLAMKAPFTPIHSVNVCAHDSYLQSLIIISLGPRENGKSARFRMRQSVALWKNLIVSFLCGAHARIASGLITARVVLKRLQAIQLLRRIYHKVSSRDESDAPSEHPAQKRPGGAARQASFHR